MLFRFLYDIQINFQFGELVISVQERNTNNKKKLHTGRKRISVVSMYGINVFILGKSPIDIIAIDFNYIINGR